MRNIMHVLDVEEGHMPQCPMPGDATASVSAATVCSLQNASSSAIGPCLSSLQ